MREIDLVRTRAARIGASSASSGDLHALFDHHKFDLRSLRWAERLSRVLFCISCLLLPVPGLSVLLVVPMLLFVPAFFPAYRYLPLIRRSKHGGFLAWQMRVTVACWFFLMVTCFPAFLFYTASIEFLPNDWGFSREDYAMGFAIVGATLGCLLLFRTAAHRAQYVWEDAS